MAAEAIAVRLADITARSAGGVAAGGTACMARVGAKAIVGWFMMTFLILLRRQRGAAANYAVPRRSDHCMTAAGSNARGSCFAGCALLRALLAAEIT